MINMLYFMLWHLFESKPFFTALLNMSCEAKCDIYSRLVTLSGVKFYLKLNLVNNGKGPSY